MEAAGQVRRCLEQSKGEKHAAPRLSQHVRGRAAQHPSLHPLLPPGLQGAVAQGSAPLHQGHPAAAQGSGGFLGRTAVEVQRGPSQQPLPPGCTLLQILPPAMLGAVHLQAVILLKHPQLPHVHVRNLLCKNLLPCPHGPAWSRGSGGGQGQACSFWALTREQLSVPHTVGAKSHPGAWRREPLLPREQHHLSPLPASTGPADAVPHLER